MINSQKATEKQQQRTTLELIFLSLLYTQETFLQIYSPQ